MSKRDDILRRVAAMVGGKDETRIREATPPAFAEVLLSIARSVNPSREIGQ